jgi:hypothetical protein
LTRENLRESFVNLLNALTNLSPSRNTLSQIIYLLPEETNTMVFSFPELKVPEAKKVLEVMGVKFENETISIINDSFAYTLHWFIHDTFDWLDDEYMYIDEKEFRNLMSEVKSGLAKLMNQEIGLIPNLYLEWTRLVVAKLVQEYSREKIKKVLEWVLSQRRYSAKNELNLFATFVVNMQSSLKTNPAELKELYEALIEKTKVLIYKKRKSNKIIYRSCSKYHVDPFIEEILRFDYYYYYIEARHIESLQKVLEEIH